MRVVRGLSGEVILDSQRVVQFDYGSILPCWTQRKERGIRATSGPDSVQLYSNHRQEIEHDKASASHIRVHRSGALHGKSQTAT